MSVFKIEKNNNYTVMSNYHLRDHDLSYKAKGLLSFMLSLPEDWDYSLAGLCSISKESRDGIRSILKELQEHHYVEIEKVRGDKGYFEYNYLIYEIPHFIDLENEQANPDMENPHLDNPNVETTSQINTNIINTKKQIDKDDKTISSYYDKLFEDLLMDGNSYKDLICIIHYIVPRVVKRNFEDEDGNIIKNKYGYFKSSIESNIHKLNNPIENLWDYDEDLFNDFYSDYSK